MSKIIVKPNRQKDGRFFEGLPFPKANAVFKHEVISLLDVITDPNTSVLLRQSLVNYVIIRSVALIENFLSNNIKKLIDERDIDISHLVKNLSEVDNLCKEHNMSKGRLVAGSLNLVNYDGIQNAIGILLGIDFFKVVKAKSTDYPIREVKGAIYLHKNWDKFIKIFDLRHDIVHGLQNPRLTNRQVRSLCDNALAMIDASSWISHPEFFELEKELLSRCGYVEKG